MFIRDGLTDFLRASITRLDTYGGTRELLFRIIAESGHERVVDLCSGSGGPWISWAEEGILPAPVTLTDRFPNQRAQQQCESAERNICYHSDPVDAMAVPRGLSGFRTMFTAFHHFTPDQGRAILRDAVQQGNGIAIFEFTGRTVKHTLGMLLTPLGVWWFTPSITPLNWRKLIFTYLLPLIPFVACADGVLSCLRSYTEQELLELADHRAGYKWTTGRQAGVTYLIGMNAANREATV